MHAANFIYESKIAFFGFVTIMLTKHDFDPKKTVTDTFRGPPEAVGLGGKNWTFLSKDTLGGYKDISVQPDRMPTIFYCEKCDFKCSKQSIYNKHLATTKHIHSGYIHPSSTDINDTIDCYQGNGTTEYKCPFCVKIYKYHSGLWRHKTLCSKNSNNSNAQTPTHADVVDEIPQNIVIHNDPLSNGSLQDQKTIQQLSEENREMKKQMNMMFEMMTTNTQFQSHILELMKSSHLQLSNETTQIQPQQPSSSNIEVNGDHNTFTNSNTVTTTTNSNNNTFNMNMFLNEKCKDAMNMKDFVNSIQLNMTDMENMDRLGYVEGMSTIFIDNLNKTDVYKRPVHCSDMKRDTLYVKENDQWEREGPDHAKMTKAVLAVEHKNVVLVNEWANANPRCLNSNTRENEKYFRLSTIVTDGDKHGNIDKVIRKVAKCVPVEKEQHKAN
ncbi:hypothetical protein EBV26_15985 [bacterium]|nr:hypothetical protein [bacterium]